MLTRSKLYERKEADKEAILFLIFCEGTKTEPNYFNYFNEINSQVKIVPVPADPQGNNSPTGLYENALKILNVSKENPTPEYDLTESDQIWFVVDTDDWGEKLLDLRKGCSLNNWFVAQSYPCFEVWLYYHKESSPPKFNDCHKSSLWKENLNSIITGGFDYRKHPIFIEKAIKNSKNHLPKSGVEDKIPFTEVHMLAERFLPLVKDEIDNALKMI